MENLRPDENIIIKAKPNWKRLIPAMMLTAVVLVLLLLIVIGMDMSPWTLLLVPFMLVMIAGEYWSHSFDELILTDKRVYGKVGIFNTKNMDTPIGKVNNVSVEQPFYGKMFNYGTVCITSSSGEYSFPYIDSPEAFRRALMEAIDQAESDKMKRQAEEIAAAMKR